MSMKSRINKEASKSLRHNPMPDKPQSRQGGKQQPRKLHGRGAVTSSSNRKKGKQSDEEDEDDGDLDAEMDESGRVKGVHFEDMEEDMDFDDDEEEEDQVCKNLLLNI